MHIGRVVQSRSFKWLSILLVLTMLAVSFPLATAETVSAAPDAVVTPATGGTGISIDTTSAGGTGTWTTLGTISGPIITEGAVGDIVPGIHTLTLPAGWEFNTAQNVTIGLNGETT